MKHKFINLLVACVAWLFVGTSPVSAQANPSKCVSLISKRLEVVGTADFDFNKARQIIKEFDFGKASEFVNDGGKRLAFQRIFTSMSEFIDLAPNDISGKAMKGYTKTSGSIIKSGDEAVTNLNITHLQASLTKNGNFEAAGFDGVMTRIADDAFASFDKASNSIKLENSGLKFGPLSYNQDERHTLTHVLRGHLENDFTLQFVNDPIRRKSIFNSAKSALEDIDEAWAKPAAGRVQVPGATDGWTIDLHPKIVGLSRNGQPTSKITFYVSPGDVLRTAFPQ